jgi:hypothetical protein
MVFGLYWYPVFIFPVVRFNGATVNELCVTYGKNGQEQYDNVCSEVLFKNRPYNGEKV